MQEYANQVAALRPMLMRVARKRLRNDTWAEDAVSETLVAALERPGAFAGRSSLQTWLVGILKHQTVNQIRRHTRECQVDIGEDETEFEKLSVAVTDCASEARARLNDPQECLRQRQFMTMLDTCLATLPPNQARAFMLRHWQEETSPDICVELGVTTANLHVLLHRARSRLRVSVSAGFTWSARPAFAPAPQYRTEAGSLRSPLPALAA